LTLADIAKELNTDSEMENVLLRQNVSTKKPLP